MATMNSSFLKDKNNSIANNIVYGIFLVTAGAPFVSLITYKVLGAAIHPFVLLLSIPTALLIFYEQGKFKIPRYIFYLFLFLVYTTISDVYLAHKSINLSYIRHNRLLGSFLLILIIDNAWISDNFKKKFLKITYFLFIVAIAIIFIQQFVKKDFLVREDWVLYQVYMGDIQLRLPSIYSWNENIMVFGLCFVPLFCVILEELLNNKQVKGNVIKLLTLASFITVFLNRTRITLVLFAISLLLFPIYQGFKIKILLKQFIVIVGVIFTLYTVAKKADSEFITIIEQRFFEKDARGIEETSAGSRILAFKIFGELFPKNPWFGKGKLHGFGEQGSGDIELVRALHHRSSQIHVGYLSLFYYYGIFGGILFLMFLFSLALKLFRDAKRTGYYAPFLVWLMFLVNNLTDVYFYFNIIGILTALIFNRYYEIKNSNKEFPHNV